LDEDRFAGPGLVPHCYHVYTTVPRSCGDRSIVSKIAVYGRDQELEFVRLEGKKRIARILPA
jgi:hypothetical protein